MPGPNKETEIKLAVPSAALARRRLRTLGLRVVHRRAFEENLLFDTAERHLRRRGQMLRLRRTGARSWLTLKQRPETSRPYKVRAEFETEVLNADRAGQILSALGYEPVFCYEKFRTTYAARGQKRGGEVMLDETPIGIFLELEGSPLWIRRLAHELGAKPSEFITKTYAELYAGWCRTHRQPLRHMTFSARFRS